MSGQKRKDPFHVNRDSVSDNVTITRKLRLPRGSQIRARRMWASAPIGGGTTATVNMPYMGNLNILVSGSSGGDTVLIHNPFLGSAAVPLFISSSPAGSTPTLVFTSIGLATLTLGGAPTNGTYIISMGVRNDSRSNGFSQ